MSFITLRIFFIGLIAFVPSPDDQRLSVLLLDARGGYGVSDGTRIPAHQPLLVARASECGGECGGEEAWSRVAQLLFPMKTTTQAGDSLYAALHHGGAWMLDGSDLSIESVSPAGMGPLTINRALRRMLDGKPDLLPQTAEESKDFSWVAELGRIDRQLGTVDPDVLSARPQKGLIVARLRPHRGRGLHLPPGRRRRQDLPSRLPHPEGREREGGVLPGPRRVGGG